jgi:hypothetical protein
MTVPAYCCSTAAFEGDVWHEQRCPRAAARRPQADSLFDIPAREEGGPLL